MTNRISQWDFSEAEDPTHGLVKFQKQADAQSKYLVFIDDGAAALTVDHSTTLQLGQKRDSYVSLCVFDLSHVT